MRWGGLNLIIQNLVKANFHTSDQINIKNSCKNTKKLNEPINML